MNSEQTYCVFVITSDFTGPFDTPTPAQAEGRATAERIALDLRAKGLPGMFGSTGRDDLGADAWDEPLASYITTASTFHLNHSQASSVVAEYEQDFEVVVLPDDPLDVHADTPMAHFLIGLPGSGKTTWRRLEERRHLTNSRPCTIVSSDDLIEEYAARNGMTYDEAFNQVDHRAIVAQLKQSVAQALEANHSLIIDRTNLTPKARREFMEMLPTHYNRTAVVFSPDDATLKQRLALREGKTIPAEILARMQKTAVSPSFGEGFDRITFSPFSGIYRNAELIG